MMRYLFLILILALSLQQARAGSVRTYNAFTVYDKDNSLIIDCNVSVYSGYLGRTIEYKFKYYEVYRREGSLVGYLTDDIRIGNGTIMNFDGFFVLPFTLNAFKSKAVLDKGIIFFLSDKSLYVFDIASKQMSTLIENRSDINDFTIHNDRLILTTDKGFELIDVDNRENIKSNSKLTEINKCISDKYLILKEGDDFKILNSENTETLSVISNKSFVCLLSDQRVITIDETQKNIIIYDSYKLQKKSKHRITINSGRGYFSVLGILEDKYLVIRTDNRENFKINLDTGVTENIQLKSSNKIINNNMICDIVELKQGSYHNDLHYTR